MGLVDQYSNELDIAHCEASKITSEMEEQETLYAEVTHVYNRVYRLCEGAEVLVIACKTPMRIEEYHLEFNLNNLPGIIGDFPPSVGDTINVIAAYKHAETYKVLSYINNGKEV